MRHMKAAPFLFEPGDWFAFFAAHGWRAAETVYLAPEGRRLGRPAPLARWLKLLLRIQRLLAPPEKRDGFGKSAGYVLLHPSEKQV